MVRRRFQYHFRGSAISAATIPMRFHHHLYQHDNAGRLIEARSSAANARLCAIAVLGKVDGGAVSDSRPLRAAGSSGPKGNNKSDWHCIRLPIRKRDRQNASGGKARIEPILPAAVIATAIALDLRHPLQHKTLRSSSVDRTNVGHA